MHTSIPGRTVRGLSLLLALLLASGCLVLTACRTASGDSATGTSGTGADTSADTESAAPDTPASTDTATGSGSEPAPETPGTEPVFSVGGGLYTGALSLALTLPAGLPESTTIRYTTNGSVPTGRSTGYSAPLDILAKADTALTVRAACFDADGNRLGQVVTNT